MPDVKVKVKSILRSVAKDHSLSHDELELILYSIRCKNCNGVGKVDDADPHGISYNVWDCTVCDGTGLDLKSV